MVLPIGFFMPLPLAMMIPFMGIQSAVMAKQFGENFQFGKRRISAMSNEEFNKLTPQLLNENANRELKSMIPSMEKSIIEMRSFQTFLIQEFIKMIQEVGLGVIGQIFGFPDLGEKITAGPVTVETEIDTGPPASVPSPIITYTQDETGNVITTSKYTQAFARQNASGRVMNNPTRDKFTYYLHSNLGLGIKPRPTNGKWRALSSGKFSKMTSMAMSAWPSKNYFTRVIKHTATNQNVTYWFLNGT